MLSTGGMLTHAASSDAKEFIVATETGMIHPLEEANPDKEFIPLDRKAVCQYMKMITLPKVRDALLDETGAYEVKVPEEIAGEGAHPDRADDLDHPLAGALTFSSTSAARSGRIIGPSSTNSKHASVRWSRIPSYISIGNHAFPG